MAGDICPEACRGRNRVPGQNGEHLEATVPATTRQDGPQ